MRTHRAGLAALAVATLAAGLQPSVAAGQIPPELLRGREVRFQSGGSRVTGELLGVDQGRLILLRGTGTVDAWPLEEVGEVSVRQHDLSFRKAMLWATIGGVATGLALTAACSSVEDTNCAPVLPAVVLSWELVGAFFGYFLGRSARLELPPAPDALRPYARFPQGVPSTFSVPLVTSRGAVVPR